jgi:hypothetical protein
MSDFLPKITKNPLSDDETSDPTEERSLIPIKGRSRMVEHKLEDSQFAKIVDFVTPQGFNIELLTQQQTQTFLGTLIDYIYDTVVLESVSLYGLIFYNRTNPWYTRKSGVSQPYDPNYECHSYHGCEFTNHKLDLYDDTTQKELVDHLKCYTNAQKGKLTVPYESFCLQLPEDHQQSIQYQLVYDSNQSNPEKFDLSEDDYTHYDEEERTSHLDRVYLYDLFEITLKKFDWSNYQLLTNKSFEFINRCGSTEDHRASNHARIILDFNEQFPIDDHPTIMTFAEACYRIKWNKFDYWYELYAWIDLKVTKDSYLIDVNFDHGS